MRRKRALARESQSEWYEPTVEDIGCCDQVLIDLVCDDCEPERFSEKLYATLEREKKQIS